MTANLPKNTIPRRMLNGLIALIVISTVLFVVGIVLERTTEAVESPGAHTETSSKLVVTNESTVQAEAGESAAEHASEVQPTTVATHTETGESAAEHASESKPTAVATHTEAGESAAEHASEGTHAETVLGINLEDPVFVIGAVVVWLILIAGLLTVGIPFYGS